ncbi:MAG: CoA-binding protein [Myxococcales bacterium]|nr:CoA-binding protein [Myxococcales bacterium]
MPEIRWLRISYWLGAAIDALAAAAMLFPDLGRLVYGISEFQPGADYRYAMGLGASLMLGWSVLLLWADRDPLARRGVLPITVFVVAGLAWAGASAVSSGLIPLPRMIPTWVMQGVLAALFLYSYLRASRAAAMEAISSDSVPLAEGAAEFLAQKRFAVAGVSRSGNAPANLIFKKLRASGREVYAINPNAESVEGERCYASLADLPEPPDAVMIATHPDQAMEIARQCRAAGVRRIWFHRSIDGGSFSPEAAAFCEAYGATVIPGGCPMMHLGPVDVAHRCMRAVLSLTGSLPKTVQVPKA